MYIEGKTVYILKKVLGMYKPLIWCKINRNNYIHDKWLTTCLERAIIWTPDFTLFKLATISSGLGQIDFTLFKLAVISSIYLCPDQIHCGSIYSV
jgi:hypothetical protein